jgi:hypothetical protein
VCTGEAMERALRSPEMGAAVESAKDFLDMEKTGLISVAEKTVIDAGLVGDQR